jgi:hypothetical protein
VREKTDKVQVIAVLKAIVQPHDPLGSTGGIYQRCGLEDISLGSNMTFLTFAQHIGFA